MNETDNESYEAQEGEESAPGANLETVYNNLWTIGFSTIVAIGTLGNGVVLWIILGHKRMWNSTNYLLVNLSIVDLLMTLLNTVFNFIFMRDKNWPFGSTYCVINNFVVYVTVSASVLTLTAITLERYRAIIYPLRPKLSRSFIVAVILFIWIISCILAVPTLLYSKLLSNGVISACVLYWPDGVAHNSKIDYLYNIIFFITTYVVPMSFMAFCYTRMGRHLWGSPIVGEETPTLLKNYQSKKKVVKMFIIIVSVFGICWLPYHGYFLYVYHNKDVVRLPYIKHVYLSFYFLAMSNVIVNPIIYFWMNVRFRGYFFHALLFIPRLLCCKRNQAFSPESHHLRLMGNPLEVGPRIHRTQSCHNVALEATTTKKATMYSTREFQTKLSPGKDTTNGRQDRLVFNLEHTAQQQPFISDRIRSRLHSKVAMIKWKANSKKKAPKAVLPDHYSDAERTVKGPALFRRPHSPVEAQEYPAEPLVPHRVQSMPNLSGSSRGWPTKVELVVSIKDCRRPGQQLI